MTIDKIFAWITSLPNATQGFIAAGFVIVLVAAIYIMVEIDYYIRHRRIDRILDDIEKHTKRPKYPPPPVPPKHGTIHR